jgi:predicted MPP superfamily phosphohydrolase
MNIWSFVIFLSIVLTILGVIHLFLYKQVVGCLGIQAPGVLWTLRVVFVLLVVSYPVARWLDTFASDGVVKGAHWIASVWLGLMFHLLWILAVFVLVRLVMQGTGLTARLGLTPESLRRTSVLLAIAAAVVLGIVGMIVARQSARVRKVTVPVAGLDASLDGIQIAVVADLHAGVLVDAAEVNRRVDEIQALEPDLVLIPGDIVDHPPGRMADVATALSRLRAPLGVFASTGNHEYIVGVEESLAFLRGAGLRVLVNERVEVPGGLVIAGIADASAPRFGGEILSLETVLGADAKVRPVILLSHTPGTKAVEAAAAAGADLQLSGHSHGGQIWPFRVLTGLVWRYHHGLYAVGDRFQLTTCGIGWWGPPMRLGAPPEIVLVTLTTP